MLKLLKSDKLEFPLTSEKNKTYVSPILEKNCCDKNFYKLAQGWRYFRYLNVIQKISDKLFIKVMSLEQFLLQAKKSSFNCKKFSELIVHNLTKKRDCNIDLDFSKPNLMGVINITPDSFYKKSRVSDIKKFITQFNKMKKFGVDIIDIGAESTKPGSNTISIKDEINRLDIFLKQIENVKSNTIISLDTKNHETMKKSLKSGISLINDVTAFSSKKSQEILIKNDICGVILHMQNNPKNMQLNPKYIFPPTDIFDFFEKKIIELSNSGIKSSKIIIDPGFGFGKSLHHNITLLRYLPLFHSLGVPIAVGLSRKSLIKEISMKKFKFTKNISSFFSPEKRLGGSLALALKAYDYGVQILRTHDPLETLQAIYCMEEVDINH